MDIARRLDSVRLLRGEEVKDWNWWSFWNGFLFGILIATVIVLSGCSLTLVRYDANCHCDEKKPSVGVKEGKSENERSNLHACLD